jgi:uncharacterized repeat protein (TIGR01451 family)
MKTLILITLFILYSISQSIAITVSVGYIDETCGNSNGAAWVYSISGGVAPFTYLWSNGSVNDNISNLSAGNYIISVTDALGDTASVTVIISNNPTLNVAGTYSYVSCDAPGVHPCPFPPCNGAIGWCVTYNGMPLMGGIPPYNITSNIGTTGISFNGNPFVAGLCNNDILFVTITDAVGCSGSISMVVEGPEYPNPAFQIIGECNSSNNGSVIISNTDYIFQDMGRITDSFYNPLSSWFNFPGNQSFLYDSLSAGDYYLEYTFGGPVSGPCVSYFPFTIPDLGSNCSTIEGNVFVDFNSNCTFDIGEVGLPNAIIEFTPGPYYAYTGYNGSYSTNLPWGTYNATQIIQNNLIQTCTSIPTLITLSALNPNIILDFADSSLILFDISTNITGGQARPGFDFSYGVLIKNHSYEPSGLLTVTLDYDPLLSFVSANPAPFSTSPGQVVWQLNSLSNFQSGMATVTLNVPANPLLIGDTLIATVNVVAVNPETDLTNNTASKTHIITGSFDPNEKYVFPDGAILPALNEWIDYTILFQNTGNDTAFNIVIVDTLDANLNVTTFVPGASSHAYETELSGEGIVKFIFNNILLPDSIIDEPNSHGFVSFQIKAKENLHHNTIISNSVDIYFDFNPPITTNTVENNIDLSLAIQVSDDTICEGEQITLSIIPEIQGTATWNWFEANCSGILLGSGNFITVAPNTSTKYFVRDSAETIPPGSCFQKSITILSNSSFTQNINLCHGQSITIGTNIYSTTGIYTDVFTSSNNCDSIVTTNLTVYSPIDVTTVVNSNTITANASGVLYQWLDCDNNFAIIPNETNQTFEPGNDGNYAVIISDNACSDTSACIPIVLIGVSELKNDDLLIFPNPTTGKIKIISNTKSELKIELTDVLGHLLNYFTESNNTLEIDFSLHKKGIYFIKIISGENVIIKKVIYL